MEKRTELDLSCELKYYLRKLNRSLLFSLSTNLINTVFFNQLVVRDAYFTRGNYTMDQGHVLKSPG